jgi:hypothetical protein
MRSSVHCLLLTVGLLVCAELGLRVVRGDATLPYSYRQGGYLALVPELDEHGAGEVAIVGSSRAREAILSPTLERVLRERGTPASVRNYAQSGAHADAVNQTIRHLLRADPAPKLIVYGVSPLQLETQRSDPASHLSYNWELEDAYDAFLRGAPDVTRYLPNAIRNELAHVSLLVRLRPTVRAALTESPRKPGWPNLDAVWRAPASDTNPMRGQLPPKQQGQHKNRVTRVSQARIDKYLKGLYQEPEYPYTRQVPWLRDSIELCRTAGVPLLLAEVPAAPILVANSPKHTYPGFYRLMRELAREFDVRFVALDDLDVSFDERDYREQSHTTYRGALKFTRALGPFIDVPE